MELCLAYFVCVPFLAYFVRFGQNMLESTICRQIGRRRNSCVLCKLSDA